MPASYQTLKNSQNSGRFWNSPPTGWMATRSPRPPIPAALDMALALHSWTGGRLDRLVAVERSDTPDDPSPAACAALTRSAALGWRAVLSSQRRPVPDRRIAPFPEHWMGVPIWSHAGIVCTRETSSSPPHRIASFCTAHPVQSRKSGESKPDFSRRSSRSTISGGS
jgi:hypothetical protein